MKKAFTLIELMVVVAIIAILVSALMAAFGGSTESARAVKCMANLRNLATAAIAAEYPPAGSYETIPKVKFGQKLSYDETVGWISWLSNHGDPYGNHTQGKKKPTSHQTVEVCPFYGTGNRDDELYALTNGVLWKYANQNRDIYVCPAHRRYRQEHQLSSPIWSYVMNMQYGYDDSQGLDVGLGIGSLLGLMQDRPKEKILLFTELPVDLTDGDIWQSDCTLQYKATVDGKKLGNSWKGKAEAIGFNHKVGKKLMCGHVAFADGHVEKIVYDTKAKNSGLKPEELTALLCEGYDLSFDGGAWKKIPGQD